MVKTNLFLSIKFKIKKKNGLHVTHNNHLRYE